MAIAATEEIIMIKFIPVTYNCDPIAFLIYTAVCPSSTWSESLLFDIEWSSKAPAHCSYARVSFLLHLTTITTTTNIPAANHITSMTT